MRSAGDEGKGEERKEAFPFSLFPSPFAPPFLSVSVFLPISDILLLFYEESFAVERETSIYLLFSPKMTEVNVEFKGGLVVTPQEC